MADTQLDVLDAKPSSEPDLADVYESVQDAEPDKAAKVLGLSALTGEHPETVHENLPVFERAAAAPTRQQFKQIALHHPVVGNFLSDPLKMAVAHDDVDNLVQHSHANKELERTHGIAEAIAVGLENSILGMTVRNKTPDVALPEDASFAEKFAGSAAQFAADFPFMALGGVLGGAAGSLAGPTGTIAGSAAGGFALPDAYRVALRQHMESGDEASAVDFAKQFFTLNALKAGIKGGVTGLLTAGAGAAAKPLGKLAVGAAEVGTMTTAGAVMEGKKPEAADIASNALLMGLMHSAGVLGEHVLDRAFPQRVADTIRVEATKDAAALLDESSKASKLRARDPESFKNLMDQGKPVMVPIEAYESYFQSKGLDPEKVSSELGVSESHDIARKTGGAVVIPQGAYLSKEMDTHRAGLIDDIKFNQDHFTANELKDVQEAEKEQAKLRAEFIKKQGEVAEKATKSDEAIKEVHQQITDDARQKLEARVPVDMLLKDKEKWLDANAKIVADHYVAEASRRKTDAAQLYAAELPTIAGDGKSAAGSIEQEAGGPGEPGQNAEDRTPAGESASRAQASSQGPGEGSSDISIDPKIGDVKAQADDWLNREAASRGMAHDEKFRLQFATHVHDGINALYKQIMTELRALPEEQRQEFMGLLDEHPATKAQKLLSAKFDSLRAAYPEAVKAIPHDRTAADKVLEGFKDHPGESLKQGAAQPTKTPEFKNWFGESKVVDENGEPAVAYHGARRPDRIGERFRKSRATSGPMPFFTDNPELASGYASGKSDTSIENHDYAGWYKFKPKGSRSEVDIDRAWWHLTAEQRQKISDLAPRVGQDDDGNIILQPEGEKRGLGGYAQHIKEARGNHLKALVEEWLNSGGLYDQEEKFGDVLEKAGMTGARYDSPYAKNPGVFPVYLSIKNPLDTSNVPPEVVEAIEKRANRQRPVSPDQQGADLWDKSRRDPQEWVSELKKDIASGKNSYVWSSIPDWVTDTLKKHGYDGIKDIGGKGGGEAHHVWVPFEETQVKSAVGNSGAFDPSNPNILKQGAQGEYVPSLNEIRLNKNSDASTFMHEFSHGALQHMFEFVKSGAADADYMKHFDAVKDFLDIKDDQTKLSAEQHEKFARAWERYLRGEDTQGGATKAPTKELQGTFNMFRRWLTKVYRQIQGSPLGGELTPEVRGFFDRMVATEDQIAQAAQEAGYSDGEIANIEDIDPAAQQRHRTLQERARDQAENELLKDQMAELSYERKEILDKERERAIRRLEPEVAEHPLYRAMSDVEENRPGPRKSAATLADEFLASKLSDQERGAFESAAEVYGFADGQDLAQTIKADNEAGGQASTLKNRVDEAMKSYADLKDTAAIREAALKYIHENLMTELLALEQEILSGMQHDQEVRSEVTKRSRVSAKLAAENAREQAKAYLASRPLREAASFRTFITAERQAAVRVSKAIAAKDFEAAAVAKGQQMLNHALASEAMKNKAEINRKGKFLDKFIKRGQDMMNMPYGFVTKIDDMLVANGLMNPRDPALQDTLAKNAQAMADARESPASIANATGLVQGSDGRWTRETLEQFVARVNDDYYPMQLPDSVMGAQGEGIRQINKNMSLAQLRDLHEAIKIVNTVGVGFERYLSDFIKGDIKANAKEFREQVEKNIGTPHGNVPALGELDMNKIERAVANIKAQPDGMIASKVNLLTLCEYLDRLDPNGAAKKNVYRPLREAENKERAMKSEYAERLNAIREKHYTKDEIAKMGDESFAKWQIDTPEGKKNVRLTKENALVLLLNRGSESNMDRITRGFGKNPEEIRAITDGLDKRDHDFAQEIWHYVSELWPEASALEMKVNGVEPVKVKATPVESRHGTYEGGYYPLAYDFTKSADAYKLAEQRNALFKQYSTAAAHTEQGALKERVKSLDRPVRLTFDGLFSHLEDVIHDISYRPSVIDVSRFLNQPDAKNAIVNAIGIEGYKKIGDDLKAAASTQNEFLTPTDKRMRWFRFATSFATLGYRVAIFPRRITEDVMNSMREVGFRNAIGATADYVMNPQTTRDFVLQNVPVMRERGITRERDLMEMSRQWKGRDSKIKMYAFLQDTLADQAMSYPVASAVYKSSVAKYGPEMAGQLAGEAIIKTFGSGSQIDRVGAQRGSELTQLLSMYYSWHSMMFNRAWLQGKIAGLEYNEGNYGKAMGIIAATTATTWVLPAAIDTFWHEVLHNAPNGQETDEEKHKRRLSKFLEAPFAYFPMARSVAAFGIPRLVGEKGRDYKMSPAEDAIENLTKTVSDGTHNMFDPDKQFDQKFMEQAARSASILLGTPNQLNTWVFNFKDYLDGEGELTWRDLVSRRTKK